MPSRPSAIADFAAVDAGLRVGGVVDRHDLDLPAENPVAIVELRRGQFGALQHALAEHRLFARERCLEPDPEGVRALVGA